MVIELRKLAPFLAAGLITACAAEPVTENVLRPGTGEREGTNGGPRWSAPELVNVMEGNGFRNDRAHRRYEAKARAIVGLLPGPVKDPIDQETLGGVLGVLTNTSGLPVRIGIKAVVFGDHPNGWMREDRAHSFRWLGGPDVEARFCVGDDVERGKRDTRRADSYRKADLGAFTLTTPEACANISAGQQKDQAYIDMIPEKDVFAETSVLATLHDPEDEEIITGLERGKLELPPPKGDLGTWVLFKGELFWAECEREFVDLTGDGYSCDAFEEKGEETAGDGKEDGGKY